MKLKQLNFHRNVTDIVELFKICKGFTCCNIVNDRFVHNNTKRDHIFKLSVLRLLSKPCRAFLTNRCIKMFNSLPNKILDCINTATFRLHACRFYESSQSKAWSLISLPYLVFSLYCLLVCFSKYKKCFIIIITAA